MFKKRCVLFCILFFATTIKVALPSDDHESYIWRLRYPKSYDVNAHQNKADNTFTVKYTVKLSFPSKDVLQFYDEKLKKIGWDPFVEPYYREGDRVWERFIDGTVEGQPLVHQLLAKWVNKDKTRMVFLFIRYYSINLTEKEKLCVREPNNDIQNVTLESMPFMVLPPPGTKPQ